MNEMIEVARNSVQTWECDQMGHMNVQFYIDKATQGLGGLGQYLGLKPPFDNDGIQLRARDQHIRFLREQRPGAAFSLRAGVLDVQPDQLVVYQEMVNTYSGDIAATFSGPALLEKPDGTPLPLPRTLIERAENLRVQQPEHGYYRGLQPDTPRQAPSLAEAERLGMLQTLICAVRPDHCDQNGYLLARRYMGMISDGVPNLLAHMEDNKQGSLAHMGAAALEYRLIYRTRPRAGDVLAMRSAVKAFSGKTYTLCHWLFDLHSGQAVGTFEAVAIALDLKARKAMTLPDAVHEQLSQLVIPELGV